MNNWLVWMMTISFFSGLGTYAYAEVLRYPGWNPFKLTLKQRTRVAGLLSVFAAFCFSMLVYVWTPSEFTRQMLIVLLMIAGLFMSYRLPLTLNFCFRTREGLPNYAYQDMIRLIPLVVAFIALNAIG